MPDLDAPYAADPDVDLASRMHTYASFPGRLRTHVGDPTGEFRVAAQGILNAFVHGRSGRGSIAAGKLAPPSRGYALRSCPSWIRALSYRILV